MVDVPTIAADRLRAISTRRSYGTGHVIFRQGHSADGLYLIASGELATSGVVTRARGTVVVVDRAGLERIGAG